MWIVYKEKIELLYGEWKIRISNGFYRCTTRKKRDSHRALVGARQLKGCIVLLMRMFASTKS